MLPYYIFIICYINIHNRYTRKTVCIKITFLFIKL